MAAISLRLDSRSFCLYSMRLSCSRLLSPKTIPLVGNACVELLQHVDFSRSADALYQLFG